MSRDLPPLPLPLLYSSWMGSSGPISDKSSLSSSWETRDGLFSGKMERWSPGSKKIGRPAWLYVRTILIVERLQESQKSYMQSALHTCYVITKPQLIPMALRKKKIKCKLKEKFKTKALNTSDFITMLSLHSHTAMLLPWIWGLQLLSIFQYHLYYVGAIVKLFQWLNFISCCGICDLSYSKFVFSPFVDFKEGLQTAVML